MTNSKKQKRQRMHQHQSVGDSNSILAMHTYRINKKMIIIKPNEQENQLERGTNVTNR